MRHFASDVRAAAERFRLNHYSTTIFIFGAELAAVVAERVGPTGRPLCPARAPSDG